VGLPLRELVLSYRPVELRAAVEQVRVDRVGQRLIGVALERPDKEPLWLEVHVTPLLNADSQPIGTTVAYLDVTTTHRLFEDLEQANSQLTSAFEELQSTGEELETTNEELQSTVEELETTNEELQSTNEELETMNEELRSTNDELQRFNDAVDEHSGEVVRLNRFLESILASLQGAVVALDTDMRVTVWNERAQELWGVRRDEAIGQLLPYLDIGLPVEQLRPAILASLSRGVTASEHRVTAINRRGRTVEVNVRITTLLAGGEVSGAMLLME
jgi:two-component system CheB/CheR fusion protein